MKKYPHSYLQGQISLGNNEPIGEDYGVKKETEDILSYLSERDLKTISSEKQQISLEDFQEFIDSKVDLEKEGKVDCIKNYVAENLQELRNLKKELNNLHIKMFWEHFKEKVVSLGSHDFFELQNGELKDKALGEYIGLLKEGERMIDDQANFTNKAIVHEELDIKIFKVQEFINAIMKMSKDYTFAIHGMYDSFISKNGSNTIIACYNILEFFISEKTHGSSKFKEIFPDFNNDYLLKYFLYKIHNGENITIINIKTFLKNQNKNHIKDSLTLGSVHPILLNLHGDEYLEYNNDKGVVEINYQKIPLNYIERINKDFEDNGIFPMGDGKCPVARTKGKNHNKNLLLEQYEFFDNYILKVLPQYFY